MVCTFCYCCWSCALDPGVKNEENISSEMKGSPLGPIPSSSASMDNMRGENWNSSPVDSADMGTFAPSNENADIGAAECEFKAENVGR